MSERKIPSGISQLPKNSRDFVIEAARMSDAGFDRETVLRILKHSDTVFEFVKIAGLLKFIGIDDYVMEELVNVVFE